MGINKVILIGNVGKDAETSLTKSQKLRSSFPFATSESFKNDNGDKVTRTEWHNIVCWGKNAEIAGEFIKKGMSLYIEGRIRTRSWKDGDITKYISEIHVDNFQMLGSGKKANDNSDDTDNIPEDDDLPF